MNNVICECCFVVHGWIRGCNCSGGPTRTDPTNPFGLKEPWINTSMGRNERDPEPCSCRASECESKRGVECRMHREIREGNAA